MALHAELRFGVCLFREPDAGNPPVRFDERGQETESSQTGLRRRGESQVNSHREAKAIAPVLDSTHLPIPNKRSDVKRIERNRNLSASPDFASHRGKLHHFGVECSCD